MESVVVVVSEVGGVSTVVSVSVDESSLLHPAATSVATEKPATRHAWRVFMTSTYPEGAVGEPGRRNVPAPRARRSRPALRPGLAVLGLLGLDDRGEILRDLLLHGALVHAGRREHAVAVLEFEEREEDVLGADVVVPESQGFAEGQLEGLAG